MAIALATLDAAGIATETESDFDELTESSDNLFLRNLSKIIADSEQTTSTSQETQLSITEVAATPQPQFGYFLPLSFTPKLRTKRSSNLITFPWRKFIENHDVSFPTGILTSRAAHQHHSRSQHNRWA